MIKLFLFVISITTFIIPFVSANNAAVDTSIFEGKVIDSIEIDNRNIYDTEQDQYNKFLFKAANKIHQTTQKYIIKREVLLKEGLQFSQTLAEETARVLRQRFVLYDAWVEKEIYDSTKLLVRIVTIDRWSLSVGADIRREGNENELKIGVRERNLFGQNRLISYHYIRKSDEDNYSDGSFVDNRLFGNKIVGKVSFSSNPLDKFKSFSIGKPYYNLNDKFGFNLSTSYKSGRIDYRSNDSLISQSFYKGDRLDTDLFYRVGSYQKKYLFKLSYVYNFEKNESDSLLPGAIQDTMYHSIKTGLGYSLYDYVKKYNIDGFNFTEDFNNGVEVYFENQNVYSISDINNIYNILTFKLRKNLITSQTLSSFQFFVKNWTNSSGSLRQSRGLNIKYYNQKVNNVIFAWNLDYLYDKSSVETFDFVRLGGTTGLRGVDKYFLTGDEKFTLNSEMRFLPTVSLFSFHTGVALFTDIANIIQSDDSFVLSNTYMSFGGGLRIAFDRSSRNIIRVDFAYNKNSGWQLSFATGQYFKALDQY